MTLLKNNLPFQNLYFNKINFFLKKYFSEIKRILSVKTECWS